MILQDPEIVSIENMEVSQDFILSFIRIG